MVIGAAAVLEDMPVAASTGMLGMRRECTALAAIMQLSYRIYRRHPVGEPARHRCARDGHLRCPA